VQAPEWVTATLAKDDFQTKTMQRVALYPLDWFRAFLALREKGKGEEVIAAPFFVTLQIVKQWLKSASVAHALPNRLVSKKFQAGVPRAGVSVTQGRDGSLAVGRGYVQPEDDPPEEAAGQDVVGAYTMGQGGDVGASSLKPSATFAWASRVPEARIIGAAREGRGPLSFSIT
jgi:hypothetical protein